MDAEITSNRAGQAAGNERRAPTILESTQHDDLAHSVETAQQEAIDAVAAFDDLSSWLKRLQPYFDREPDLTVAQALQRYLADRPSETSSTRRAGEPNVLPAESAPSA